MTPTLLLADLVLALHVALVLFVGGGLLLILVGNGRRWHWVNRLWFRLAHLATIVFVVAETWFGVTCPLTTLENWLRVQAHRAAPYRESFVGHWLRRLLYYDAPEWVFAVGYTLFGLLVLAVWWRFPPRRPPDS